MNIKKQIKKTVVGKSKKVYKLTSNNISASYFCSFIKIKSLFKDPELVENKLESYCKIIRISKLYDRLSRRDLSADEIIFLSKFYFKKTKRYYYFSPRSVLKIPDLRKFIDFYLNEVKLSIGKLFDNVYTSNIIDTYKYLKSKNIIISNKIKYRIIERVVDSNNKNSNYYFFTHADFKETLISYLHLNYSQFYYNLSVDRILLYKNYYLFKLLKKAYEKNNKYNDFINLIVNELYTPAHLRDIFDALQIPRKHIYIATKDVPDYFFSNKHPNPNVALFC